jgi:hypothetical protein
MAPKKDIRKAPCPIRLLGRWFKGKILPRRVIRHRRFVTHQATKVNKMFLRDGPFFLDDPAPLGDKFFRLHWLNLPQLEQKIKLFFLLTLLTLLTLLKLPLSSARHLTA